MNQAMYQFVQGDQSRIYFVAQIGQERFTGNQVENIEVSIGRNIVKTLQNEEVFYHSDFQLFSFILTQEDTLFLRPGIYYSAIRIKLADFDGTCSNLIRTIEGPSFQIFEGYSKEII